MTIRKDLRIHVPTVSRVEGEGALHVRVTDGPPAEVELVGGEVRRWQERVLDAVARAANLAVETEHALGGAQRALRVGGALTAGAANLTVLAQRGIFAQAEQRETGQQAEQRAQRAEQPAVETRDEQVERQRCEEERDDHRAEVEVSLPLVEAECGVVDGRDHRRGERSPGERDWIEQTDLIAADDGRCQRADQDEVGQMVRPPWLIDRHPIAHLPVDEPAEEMVQRAHRADPATEEATEDEGQHDERDRPGEGGGDRVGRERRRRHDPASIPLIS